MDLNGSTYSMTYLEVVLLLENTIIIGGRRGIMRVYSKPSSKATGGQNYQLLEKRGKDNRRKKKKIAMCPGLFSKPLIT